MYIKPYLTLDEINKMNYKTERTHYSYYTPFLQSNSIKSSQLLKINQWELSKELSIKIEINKILKSDTMEPYICIIENLKDTMPTKSDQIPLLLDVFVCLYGQNLLLKRHEACLNQLQNCFHNNEYITSK